MTVMCSVGVGVILLACLAGCYSVPKTYIVGGQAGWNPEANWPNPVNLPVGHKLVFISRYHHVVEVSLQGYTECSEANPIQRYPPGQVDIPLREPGKCYFICKLPHGWAKAPVALLKPPGGIGYQEKL